MNLLWGETIIRPALEEAGIACDLFTNLDDSLAAIESLPAATIGSPLRSLPYAAWVLDGNLDPSHGDFSDGRAVLQAILAKRLGGLGTNSIILNISSSIRATAFGDDARYVSHDIPQKNEELIVTHTLHHLRAHGVEL